MRHRQEERKKGMTDEQFYYKARKKAIGPFKQKMWELSDEARVRSARASRISSPS